MNCNTPFHNFWKNFDVDAFIPYLIVLNFFVGILYCYAFNTRYYELYESADIVSYKEYKEILSCPDGNKNCNEHKYEYVVIKYKHKQDPHVIHITTIPRPSCSNVSLIINSDKPTKLKKYKSYNEYVGIFFTGNNSSKKLENDLFVLE